MYGLPWGMSARVEVAKVRAESAYHTDTPASTTASTSVRRGIAHALRTSRRSARAILEATGNYSSPPMNRASRSWASSSGHCSGGDFMR